MDFSGIWSSSEEADIAAEPIVQELIFINFPYQSALACLVPSVFVLIALKTGRIQKGRLIKIAGWTSAILVVTIVGIFVLGCAIAFFQDPDRPQA